MDLFLHIILVLAAMSQGAALYAAFSTLYKVEESVKQIGESVERVAQMASRNEAMVMEIYGKVHGVSTPQA